MVYANPTIQQQQEDETLLFHYGYVVIVKYIRSGLDRPENTSGPEDPPSSRPHRCLLILSPEDDITAPFEFRRTCEKRFMICQDRLVTSAKQFIEKWVVHKVLLMITSIA